MQILFQSFLPFSTAAGQLQSSCDAPEALRTSVQMTYRRRNSPPPPPWPATPLTFFFFSNNTIRHRGRCSNSLGTSSLLPPPFLDIAVRRHESPVFPTRPLSTMFREFCPLFPVPQGALPSRLPYLCYGTLAKLTCDSRLRSISRIFPLGVTPFVSSPSPRFLYVFPFSTTRMYPVHSPGAPHLQHFGWLPV